MTEPRALFPLNHRKPKLEDCARPLEERSYSLAQSGNAANFAYREETPRTKPLEKSGKLYYL